jgi:hypothetical protein
MTLSLTSPAFAPNGDILQEYTCDGKDLAPPLEWSGAPAGTRSFAIIVDDPDAPDPQAPKTSGCTGWAHSGEGRAGWDLPAREVVAVPDAGVCWGSCSTLPYFTRSNVGVCRPRGMLVAARQTPSGPKCSSWQVMSISGTPERRVGRAGHQGRSQP